MTSAAATEAGPSVSGQPRVGLFVTCLVDMFRPSVGFAAVALLERAGCTVEVPEAQTCCGQPSWNSGDVPDTQEIAKGVIRAFEGFDYVVAPSGSCSGMIHAHYPRMFQDDAEWGPRAEHLARRTHELISFLVDIRGLRDLGPVRFDHTVTYHDSCAGLREMKVKHQPRQLLRQVQGVSLRELPGAEVCCGFGGTFCVKYPDISNRMVSEKADDIVATGADTLLAGDMGCLLNMAGKLKRNGARVQARHVAEVLAGLAEDTPPIGAGDSSQRGS